MFFQQLIEMILWTWDRPTIATYLDSVKPVGVGGQVIFLVVSRGGVIIFTFC